MSISNAQAKPTRGGCASISNVQHNQVQNLSSTSKATLDRVLGASYQTSGYGKGLSAYGYKLSYDSKNWFIAMAKSINLRFCLLEGDLEKDEAFTHGVRSHSFNRL